MDKLYVKEKWPDKYRYFETSGMTEEQVIKIVKERGHTCIFVTEQEYKDANPPTELPII